MHITTPSVSVQLFLARKLRDGYHRIADRYDRTSENPAEQSGYHLDGPHGGLLAARGQRHEAQSNHPSAG